MQRANSIGPGLRSLVARPGNGIASLLFRLHAATIEVRRIQAVVAVLFSGLVIGLAHIAPAQGRHNAACEGEKREQPHHERHPFVRTMGCSTAASDCLVEYAATAGAVPRSATAAAQLLRREPPLPSPEPWGRVICLPLAMSLSRLQADESVAVMHSVSLLTLPSDEVQAANIETVAVANRTLRIGLAMTLSHYRAGRRFGIVLRRHRAVGCPFHTSMRRFFCLRGPHYRPICDLRGSQ